MSPHKIRRAYRFMGLYALALCALHNGINVIIPHLSFLKELMIMHVIIYALCILVYATSKYLSFKNKSFKPLIVLGSISAKMFLALIIMILFYYLKKNNQDNYVFSFLIVYLFYLPVLSYFFIKDFK